MYKLIAIDMDGTLLKDDKTISKKNIEAINKASEKGVKVVLATGRPIAGIYKYLEQLDLIKEGDYTVAFNGALVQSTKDKKIIAENIMTMDDVYYLYEVSKKANINIHVCTPNSCITPKINKYSIFEAECNDLELIVKDFYDLPKDTKIIKIMMIDEKEIIDSGMKTFPEDISDRYSILRSAPYFLEFLNKKVDKGFGVSTLANHLNIKKEDVICIGDAGNDIHMLKYAGLGVAMENAFKEAKEVADYITLTNENDGVAHVINKFILSEDTDEKVC